MRLCTKCGRMLPESKFSKDMNCEGGLKHRCKDCVNANAKEYYQKIKEYNLGKDETFINPDEFLGGYKISILNHVKKGEFKFNVFETKTGEVFQTNVKDYFINYIRGRV